MFDKKQQKLLKIGDFLLRISNVVTELKPPREKGEIKYENNIR